MENVVKRIRENGGKWSLTCGNGVSLHGWFSGKPRQGPGKGPLDFSAVLHHACLVEKEEHARLLRAAMVERGVGRQTLALAVNVSKRTVGNWTSKTKPTMPDDSDRARIRSVLGDDYDRPGDAVERAVRASDLHEWRKDAVLSVYKRNLHEQQAEAAS